MSDAGLPLSQCCGAPVVMRDPESGLLQLGQKGEVLDYLLRSRPQAITCHQCRRVATLT